MIASLVGIDTGDIAFNGGDVCEKYGKYIDKSLPKHNTEYNLLVDTSRGN